MTKTPEYTSADDFGVDEFLMLVDDEMSDVQDKLGQLGVYSIATSPHPEGTEVYYKTSMVTNGPGHEFGMDQRTAFWIGTIPSDYAAVREVAVSIHRMLEAASES